jgi:hypothetical protein
VTIHYNDPLQRPIIKVGTLLSTLNMPPKPELSSDQRKQIVSQLLLLIKDGVGPPELKRGALKQVADNFNVKATTLMLKALVMRKIYRQCMWVKFIDNTCSIQFIPFPANVA